MPGVTQPTSGRARKKTESSDAEVPTFSLKPSPRKGPGVGQHT